MHIILVFLITVCIIIASSLSRKVDISTALTIGTIVYGLLVFGKELPFVTLRALDYRMFYVCTSIFFVMILGHIMESASHKIASGLSAVGSRFAALSLPAVLGLLPMPGGAYISAVVAKHLYDKIGLDANERAFINYWMRHIWVFFLPIYQVTLVPTESNIN